MDREINRAPQEHASIPFKAMKSPITKLLKSSIFYITSSRMNDAEHESSPTTPDSHIPVTHSADVVQSLRTKQHLRHSISHQGFESHRSDHSKHPKTDRLLGPTHIQAIEPATDFQDIEVPRPLRLDKSMPPRPVLSDGEVEDAIRENEILKEELRTARSIIYRLLRALAINARHESKMEENIARLSVRSDVCRLQIVRQTVLMSKSHDEHHSRKVHSQWGRVKLTSLKSGAWIIF